MYSVALQSVAITEHVCYISNAPAVNHELNLIPKLAVQSPYYMIRMRVLAAAYNTSSVFPSVTSNINIIFRQR